MSRAASGGANPFSVACTCDGPPVADATSTLIAEWLRGGAGEVRACGTLAWEHSIMPIYRELADRIERCEWQRTKKALPENEILKRAYVVLSKIAVAERSIRHENVLLEIEEVLWPGGIE